MTPQNRRLLRDRNRAKVIAQTGNNLAVRLVWLATLSAALVAFIFYFFSLFLGGIEWRALTDR
jgi:hypothetical protein